MNIKQNVTPIYQWLQEDDSVESIQLSYLQVSNHCDHISASFLSNNQLKENNEILNPYNALEYTQYLDALLKEIQNKNIDAAKAILKQHKIRTKNLGGGPLLKWDIVNDTTRNCSPFQMAIFMGNEKIYLWLLSEGGDVTQNTNDGQSPLIIAVSANHLSMVNLLIAQPNIDVNCQGKNGSALYLAAKQDKFEILKLLVTHPNINLHLVNKDFETALDVGTHRCKQFLKNEVDQMIQEKNEKLLQSFRSSVRLNYPSENSFVANKPKKPPIFKGTIYKLNILKFYMYHRYIILDPESGVLARFLRIQDSPLNPIELIALDEVNAVELSVGRWFQKQGYQYLRIGYGNKEIYFAFECPVICKKWLEAIKICVGYSRYLKCKLEKYLLSKEEKKSYKRVIELLMEKVNQEIEIGDSVYDQSEVKKSESTQKSNQINLLIGIKDIDTLQLLGKGAFGNVYKVKLLLNGGIYALKQQEKLKLQRSSNLGYALNEIQILKELNHPFLVNVQCAFQTEKYLYYLMDYYKWGDFSQFITRGTVIDELAAKFIIAQLLLAIEYLHEKNILYRDLKPENIVLDDQRYIKLIDFGLSKQMKPETRLAMSFCGSPAYLSPEILNGIGATKQTDIYGIGLILYEMLTGYPPHYTTNLNELMNRIKFNSINFEHIKNKIASNLLEKMLNQNHVLRPSIQQIKDDLFFADIDWDKLYQKQLIPPNFIKMHCTKSLKNTLNTDVYVVDQEYDQFGTKLNYIVNWDFQ